MRKCIQTSSNAREGSSPPFPRRETTSELGDSTVSGTAYLLEEPSLRLAEISLMTRELGDWQLQNPIRLEAVDGNPLGLDDGIDGADEIDAGTKA